LEYVDTIMIDHMSYGGHNVIIDDVMHMYKLKLYLHKIAPILILMVQQLSMPLNHC